MKKTKILALAVTFALGSAIPLIGGGDNSGYNY